MDCVCEARIQRHIKIGMRAMFDISALMKMFQGGGAGGAAGSIGGLSSALNNGMGFAQMMPGGATSLMGGGQQPGGAPASDGGWSSGTSIDNGGAFTKGLNGIPNGLGQNFSKHIGSAMQGAAEQMPGGYQPPEGHGSAGAFASPSDATDPNVENAQGFMQMLARRRFNPQGQKSMMSRGMGEYR